MQPRLTRIVLKEVKLYGLYAKEPADMFHDAVNGILQALRSLWRLIFDRYWPSAQGSEWDLNAGCDSTAFKMQLFPGCANTRSRLSREADVIVSFLLFLVCHRRQRLFHQYGEWHDGRNQYAR